MPKNFTGDALFEDEGQPREDLFDGSVKDPEFLDKVDEEDEELQQLPEEIDSDLIDEGDING
jgi:hypothetical protein